MVLSHHVAHFLELWPVVRKQATITIHRSTSTQRGWHKSDLWHIIPCRCNGITPGTKPWYIRTYTQKRGERNIITQRGPKRVHKRKKGRKGNTMQGKETKKMIN